MSHVIYGLIDASWLPVTAWYPIAVFLNLSDRLSDRRYHFGRMVADAVYLLRCVTVGVHEHSLTTAAFGGLALAFLWWDYRAWRNSDDDDDDWGERLKSWGRSHIPKPTIVALRPTQGPA